MITNLTNRTQSHHLDEDDQIRLLEFILGCDADDYIRILIEEFDDGDVSIHALERLTDEVYQTYDDGDDPWPYIPLLRTLDTLEYLKLLHLDFETLEFMIPR